jgi:membrane protease YdiL (CAAX protease family)
MEKSAAHLAGDDSETMEKDSLPKSVVLHLMPGAIQVLVFIILAPLAMSFGYPAGLAFTAINIFVGIPLMLGYLLSRGKKRNGAFSLGGVIYNRQPMPVWQYAAFFVLLFGAAFVILFLTAPVNEFLAESTFAWLPVYFKSSAATLGGEPARSIILVMLLLQLVVDGLAVPIVEEMYFRGHLMPRVGYLGLAAPAFNAFLFAVQHFWQPFNYLLIFLIVLPQAYVVWRKQNIYIAMLTHCAANTFGAALSIIGFFSSSQ